MAAWIKMISDDDASKELAQAFELARTPHGTVDNVMRVHSLRPATLRGHVMLYRAVLHNDANRLPEWLAETISSYVSILNGCPYSLENHWANARHLIGDEKKAAKIEAALRSRRPQEAFEGVELAVLDYAAKLTLTPSEMVGADVDALREAGLDDGQILEANQIVGYFNYVNRCLNGLGVSIEGDVIGYYA